MLIPYVPKLFFIDRIEWNLFLMGKSATICPSFWEHLLEINRNILSHEKTYECIIKDVQIYSSDAFFNSFSRCFQSFKEQN